MLAFLGRSAHSTHRDAHIGQNKMEQKAINECVYIYFALKRNALCVIIFSLNLFSDACSRIYMHQGGCRLILHLLFVSILYRLPCHSEEKRTIHRNACFNKWHEQSWRTKRWQQQHKKSNTHTFGLDYLLIVCACIYFLVRSSWSLRISYGSQVLFFVFLSTEKRLGIARA